MRRSGRVGSGQVSVRAATAMAGRTTMASAISTHVTPTSGSDAAAIAPLATASEYSSLACSIALATVDAVTFGADVDGWAPALANVSSRPGVIPRKLPGETLGRPACEEMAHAV